MASDMDDLLAGLGSDDLDDFDGLNASPDGPPPPLQPISIGFATGNGRALPPPSAAAIARAQKLLVDEAESSLHALQQPPTDSDITTPSKRRRLDGSPCTASLFSTANGRTIHPPSRHAVDRAVQLLAESGVDDAVHPPPPQEHNHDRPTATDILSTTSMFTTGSGGRVSPPSDAALASVLFLFAESDLSSTKPSTTTTFTHGGETTLAAGSANRTRALAIFGELSDQSSPSLSTSTAGRSPFNSPAPRSSQSTISAVSRTPLRSTTNTFRDTGAVESIPNARPVKIKTPAGGLRRIGLGGTPRPSKGTARTAFVTPFKDPLASGPQNTHEATGSGTPIRASAPVKTATFEPVFDLASMLSLGLKREGVQIYDLSIVPIERKTMKQAFLKPQYNNPADLQELGLPDEIWILDLNNAIDYQFVAGNGATLGHINALNVLRDERCSHATGKWVDNHWRLILWKLAGQVQAQPALFDQKWNGREVIEQLKYRYEREFGAVQRPVIRRIQEHDSSASLPMILCVSQIHRPPTTENNDASALATRPYLELTDGWYRIMAEIDDCLSRAVARGKISIGRKLAVSGAKLDSASDGEEVLNALNKSRLIISGNSSSLARWYAKLGQQRRPFVAGLSSLSPDGGIISLTDVMIEKVFPLAFMFADKGGKEAPWDDADEAIRSEKWNEMYGNESARLQNEMRDRLSPIEDLVQLLNSQASEIRCESESVPDSIEQDFDDLLSLPSHKQPSSVLSTYSDTHIHHLANYARSRMETEIQSSQAEVESSLRAVLPIREVRSFRMIRFVDAQEGRKERSRVGMLNVWDAQALRQGMLSEGKRYLVSNLVPARSGDWRLPKGEGRREVYLHTRRDTRWKAVN